MSQLNGSDFGFQAVNSIDDQFVVRVDFGKTGSVKITDMLSGIQNLIVAPSIWLSNTVSVKSSGKRYGCRYYLNDLLIYTGVAASSLNINQLRFVHNNSLGSAYIDHIKINSELGTMGVQDSNANIKKYLFILILQRISSILMLLPK